MTLEFLVQCNDEVIADNSFGPESALHIPNDYQSYGGVLDL